MPPQATKKRKIANAIMGSPSGEERERPAALTLTLNLNPFSCFTVLEETSGPTLHTRTHTHTHTHTHTTTVNGPQLLESCQNQNSVYSPCMLYKHGIYCGREVQTINIYES